MINHLISLFPAMLLGAQLVLTLILVKGDICPGQRGRIHKMLPAIGVLWLATASLKIEAFMVVFAIFYFYSRVQTGKTRDAGPIWLLFLANGFALSFVGIQIVQQVSVSQSLTYFVLIFLLGASFSHLLLTIARTRLQAFHRILPVTVVIAAMMFTGCVLASIYQFHESQLALLLTPLVTSFLFVLIGVVVSCWHLLVTRAPEKIQIGLGLLLLLCSATISSQIMVI
ncbi:hypothetical protein [Vibrio genomosp. F10]|uniref:Uncharacterized protein n=1 Tax=Vibrio genomosp. F10 str. ZF-129 TaxID=1187848 RepID=A0A1E5BHV0_9VIBR|nr:hypothetical protein [Vibrio genomosp. F10]OEE36617.1 hypothetical protein A1QO_18670 [Vibrio genomosp. F10 str. ZF-129]OEF05607.1 hypothetical protein A1QK_01115 [Vibrio genomosp. F10 str. 9ZD137]